MAEGRDWLRQISGVSQWKRGGERAPHKPLLLLYLLGLVQRDGSSRLPFVEAEEPMGELLAEFGPPRPTQVVYPFHHLQSDGFCTVSTDDGSDPGASVGRLRASGAVGRLDSELEEALLASPELVARVARHLLDANWPASLHVDLCEAAGLDLGVGAETADSIESNRDAVAEEVRRRDSGFRQRVLLAYEYRCAMCGWDGRLDSTTVGLDAAHVRWWASGGADSTDNGLCLCTLHHKLLDLGALGLLEDHRITVSRHFVGRGRIAEQFVTSLRGQQLRPPQPGEPGVAESNIDWHTKQVFKTPARS